MKRIAFLILVMLLLVIPASAAFAEPLFYTTVGENETVNNDVIVFDGDLILENGAVVNGDVVVFNGDVITAGTINGDLVIFNGDLEADGAAAVNGDCVLLNGSVDDDSAQGISCTNIEGAALSGLVQGLPPIMMNPKAIPDVPAVPEVPAVPAPPVVPDVPQPARNSGSGTDIVAVLSSTLLFGFLAFVTGSLFPRHLQQVKTTVRRKPFVSGAVGVLTAVAVPALAALLAVISAVLIIVCIGLLGFPIVLLMLFGLVAGAVMGWIAVGTWLGDKLFRGKNRSVAMRAALGTMILTFAIGIFGLLPFVWGEGLFVLIIGAIGLGAVALTQFGRKPYPPAAYETEFSEDAVKVATVLETLPVDDLDPPVKR